MKKLSHDLDIERLLRIMHGFEALRSVALNKTERFFLEYQKHRVIRTDTERSSDSADDLNDDGYVNLVPYGETKERKRFLKNLKEHLKKYEGHFLLEKERRILLGVKTEKANLLDKVMH